MTDAIVRESLLLDLIPVRAVSQLEEQINELSSVVAKISLESSLSKKIGVLNELSRVKDFFIDKPCFQRVVHTLSLQERYFVKVVIAIRQAEICFSFTDEEAEEQRENIIQLLSDLREVESFYDVIGGVLGYHLASITLLADRERLQSSKVEEEYFPPFGVDLTQEDLYLRKKIVEGIASQGEMAELYPVGGAADRLNLQDERTHTDLPAARMEFLGHTLLEGMIRDLQAREYLHFKLFHRQVTTPIALMTSHEKNNDYLVQEIIREKEFFGRPSEWFKFFSQPVVPTFTKEGKWCLQQPMKLLLKPGGHGVIWKLASEKNVLQWFAMHHRTKALVRQINNPIAGVDLGLVALTGVGCTENKTFGFASCVRRVKTSEGVNILKQTFTQDGVSIVLSNIEYCDFKKFGIEDAPKNLDEPYSVFPSNTNILFVDLVGIGEVLKKLPYPGMLVNFKKMDYHDPIKGNVTGEVARLELLMQNIADGMAEVVEKTMQEDPYPSLKTFITFNKRYKTISPTKKQFVPGAGLVETALGCFYDYLKNAKELLEEYCRFIVPPLVQEENFLELGPSFVFLYHPALGPLYSIIGQKLRGGVLASGGELQLEIADVNIEQLHIEGSLLIKAVQVMGHKVDKTLCYSHHTGRCRLKNVKIKNKGIDRAQKNIYWKNTVVRDEVCSVLLEGWSEFIAEDAVLEGNHEILVKDGERVIAKQDGDHVIFIREPMSSGVAAHYWLYHVSSDYHIVLEAKAY